MSELAVVPLRSFGEASPSSAGSVLIVDDEAEIRESLRTLLELEGYEVEAASTGEEGLSRIGERTFDLVLLDVALPDRNGLDILVEDRKSTRLNSSHVKISYAVFCLKKKKQLITGPGQYIDIPRRQCFI